MSGSLHPNYYAGGYRNLAEAGALIVSLYDPATGADRSAVWCNTCGKETIEPGECDVCREWWDSNPPPAT